MTIKIYGLDDGKTACAKVYSKEGILSAEITAERKGNTIKVTVSGTDKPYTVESVQGLEITE